MTSSHFAMMLFNRPSPPRGVAARKDTNQPDVRISYDYDERLTGANPSHDEPSGGGIPRRQALMGLGALLFTAAGARTAVSQTAATTTAKELAGKVAIVTGARNNLGRAFAIVLARNGANIVVNYHRAETQAEAEETASLVRAEGVKAVLVQGDLSIVANIRKMYDVAINEFGRVDIVVNNAGYIKKKPFVEITEEEFDRCAESILRGCTSPCRKPRSALPTTDGSLTSAPRYSVRPLALLGLRRYQGPGRSVHTGSRQGDRQAGHHGQCGGPGRRRYAIFPQPGDAGDGGAHQEGAGVWSTCNRRRHRGNDRVPRIASITMALCPDDLRQQCLLSAIAIASDVATVVWLVDLSLDSRP